VKLLLNYLEIPKLEKEVMYVLNLAGINPLLFANTAIKNILPVE
jgi:hypothetical protein